MKIGLLACATLFATACTAPYLGSATKLEPSELRANRDWVAVTGVPLIKQASTADCGAAAMSMVLRYWGIDADRAEIVRAHQRQSTRKLIPAGELRDYARKQGLFAFLVHGDRNDIVRQLRRGRPLIVGLTKPYRGQVVQHYEVLVGYDLRRDRVATIDPAHGIQQNSWQGFTREWAPTSQLTLLVLPRTFSAR